MKIKFMKFVPFDQLLIGKETLYIFPLPHGIRCLVKTNGTEIEVHAEDGEDLTGFAPAVEEALKDVYLRMFSEPNPKYTVNGKQEHFPYYIFDIILHDRVTDILDDGTAEKTVAYREDDWEFLGAPVPASMTRAVVIGGLLEEEYKAGRAKQDMWWHRAWHKRAMISCGFGAQHVYPKPIVGWPEIASRSADHERPGIATDSIDESWDYIYNVFSRRHKGVLIADVWAGWNVNGSAFRIMTEEDVEI